MTKHLSLITSVALHIAVIVPFVISKQADSAIFQSRVIAVELALGEAIDDEVTESSVAQEAVEAVEKVEAEETPIETAKVIDETAETIDQKEKVEEQKTAVQQEASQDTFEKKTAGVDFGVQGGGMTAASYAANVKKMIEKNKKRPENNLKGNVKIGFQIGPNGKVESTWILSTTNEKLNKTAELIINSINTLPPPDGKFSGSIEIKFS
jgi:outer membrane biosynthesis protein TonB